MKENMEIIVRILERAERMDLLAFDRLSLMMDLELANKEFDLRLKDLLNADDLNFSHDIVGIQNNIDRTDKTFENFFLPRYSKSKSG